MVKALTKKTTICNNHTCHCQNSAGWGIVIPPSLFGGFNPSEKYEFVSWDDDIPNKWKVIKVVFKTTNQIMNNAWDFPACRLRWENRHPRWYKNQTTLDLDTYEFFDPVRNRVQLGATPIRNR
jgi:hypothetical protein